jgi:hypothetical protein
MMSRAGGAVVGALTIAVTAGAFALGPAAVAGPAAKAAGTASGGMPSLGSTRPGYPFRPAAGQQRIRANSANGVGFAAAAQSANWAGYAAGGTSATFRFVSAHFNVPYLDCSSVQGGNPVFSSHWVGLDGLSSASVEQLGIEADCDGTTPMYSSWSEMYPQAPVNAIAVHPGDSITASVYYDKSARKFTLSMTDGTTGKSYRKTAACPSGSSCPRTSAEVISEAPFGTVPAPISYTGILPLSDFQAAGFSGVAVTNTSGSQKGGLTSSAWSTFKISQVSGQDPSTSDLLNVDAAYNPIPAGHTLDQPTPLSGGTEFLDYWLPEP